MPYIFISYSEHLDKGSNLKSDFYNLSLKEQYALLQKRIPSNRQVSSFDSFIERCFPSDFTKKYFISCPNFLREKHQSADDKPSFLNNLVIRPELTLNMRSVLPDNQNIILIGDIYEGGKLKMFQVKGIQLIDSFMSSPYDIPIVGSSVCNSFTRNIWSINHVDYNDTIFTPNYIADIIENCWTVKHPQEIRRIYEVWNKYIDFRNYYLKEQSKRNFKLDRSIFVNSFAVNRKDYKKNASIYDDYLLDGRNEFTYGDMIVLSEQVEDAEEFPLIRLDIERNKKKFDEEKVNKRGRLINEEEKKIRSLASDNVFITAIDPKSNSPFKKNGETQPVTFSELINAGYVLGDRFKIISYDIEPTEHLNQLDDEYEKSIDKSYKDVDAKYERIIKKEFDDAVNAYAIDLRKKANFQIDAKEEELKKCLENDITSNNDSKILETIDKKKKEIVISIKKNNKKRKKEKDIDYKERIKLLIEREYSKIDIRSYYIARNKIILNDFKKSVDNEVNRLLSQYKTKKKLEITNKYKDEVRNEKINIKENLDDKLKKDKEKVTNEETLIRFSLYFRLGDANNIITDKQIETIKACEYIVYDNRAEKAKIARQEQALKNFYSGYVKNPYLSTYLFDPEELDTGKVEPSDWNWYLDSLNE